eukprot:925391-Pelagomonas_calceolata.AAC.2
MHKLEPVPPAIRAYEITDAQIFGKNGAYEETDLKREISKRSTVAYAAYCLEQAEVQLPPPQSQEKPPLQPKKLHVQSKERKKQSPPAVSEEQELLCCMHALETLRFVLCLSDVLCLCGACAQPQCDAVLQWGMCSA